MIFTGVRIDTRRPPECDQAGADSLDRMNEERYRSWVERYVRAWNTNEPGDIEELFAEKGSYLTEPYASPWVGSDEIARQWIDRKDEPGETRFDYEVLVSNDDIGIVKGQTLYKSDGSRYDNLWEVRLDPDGRCTEFVEWWMKRPEKG
jgi:hypothetical protein